MRHLLCALLLLAPASAAAVSPSSQAVAEAAADRFEPAVELLAELLAFRTVRDPAIPNAEHPEFQRMSAYLGEVAASLGLDFADHGAVVVIGLGDAEDRLGLVTHGDVQPADPDKWAADPFTLDRASEPGRLLGRGAEDDKGPIAIALHAMAALRESGLPLRRRVELIISHTEESDWTPFREFLETYPMPELNVALDAEYPVVTAEKGWCLVSYGVDVPAPQGTPNELLRFTGGRFLSQVPGEAVAVVARPDSTTKARLWEASDRMPTIGFGFRNVGDTLEITATGKAAHSSKPHEGWNAVAFLAELLGRAGVHEGPAAPLLRFTREMVGLVHDGGQFGRVSYRHPFMGPLSLSLTLLTQDEGRHVANLNFRRPAGKTNEEFEASLRQAISNWEARSQITADSLNVVVTAPYLVEDAPHIPVLLDVFQHYTGTEDPRPIAIGGGTHARLVPNGVNFGPAMPGVAYTGHSEHEFMTEDQFRLNLRMYAAMLAELAAGD